MTIPRTCSICNSSLSNKRSDAKTCSPSCRTKLFRSNQTSTVLVKVRIPLDTYTNLTIKAFKARAGIDDYLVRMVQNNE